MDKKLLPSLSTLNLYLRILMENSLENAPDDIKLAVDLICLLEENQIDPKTVLSALEIVKKDFENKIKQA